MMYQHTKFESSMSYDKEDMLSTRFCILLTAVRSHGHNCPKVVRYILNIKMHPYTKFEILPQIMWGICWGYDFSCIGARGQGHSDLKQYVTFQYPNMYPKYGISMSYNIGDMLHQRF